MAVRRTQKRNASRDLSGRLRTQSGPRTTAPMWPRPFFTPGEWAVYTALWSYPNESVFPTHQDLADRAWVERGTAADAVAKMDREGLLEREAGEREDGSQTSNTYYLVEVPSAAQLAKLEELKTQRAAEQEAKRRKRKASNRRYEKQQLGPREAGGYGGESTPSLPTGGTAEKVPRGSGARRTPGGTAQTVPGSGARRTQETLGVTAPVKDKVSSPSATGFTATHDATNLENQEKKPAPSSDLANQEEQTARYVRDDPRHYPTLTDAEQALLAEVVAIAPLWSERMVRRVLGSDRIRAIAQRDPELVRRAFLSGARDAQTLPVGTVPMRMWHVEKNPHWAAAARELAAERSGVAAGPVPCPAPAGSAVARSGPVVNESPVVPLPAGEDPRALARANAKPLQPAARRSRVPKPAVPSDDAAGRLATEAAREQARAALAQAFPGEVPAPA